MTDIAGHWLQCPVIPTLILKCLANNILKSQSFEDDCSLSDFGSAGLSLCNVSEMENSLEILT